MVAVSEAFSAALRSSSVQWCTVTASRAGSPVAADMRIVSGSVTDDASTGGVRRTLNLTLIPMPGLYDALAIFGTQLTVTNVLRYPTGATELTPMGVFDIDSEALSYSPDGNLVITAPDKWVRVKRARFINPETSTVGATVAAQITSLIQGALGGSEPVTNLATSTVTIGALVWEQDRDKAITELADSIGAYVSFDRTGACVIKDVPTLAVASEWLVDASASGIMLTADRDRNRQKTFNVVKVSSDKADGTEPFTPVVVWDNDPLSPTYAGPDPVSNPTAAGPFGVVPFFFESAIIDGTALATSTANSILYRVIGLAAQLSLTAVRNPALDSLSVIDVLLPKEDATVAQVVERHIVDRVTHPLMADGTQSITTRSTRADAFA